MRIIHISDLHMGSPLTARLPHEKIAERKRELLSSFRRIAEEGSRLGVSLIIIAGDLFDTQKIGKRTADAACAVIEAAKEITFLYLPGNHEKNAFSESGIPLPENLKIFGDDWTYFDFEDLTVAGRAETEKNMFRTLSLDPKRKNIVVLHGELRDRSDAGGVIGEKDVPEETVDLLCLGHYHGYSEKQISRRTKAIYCGTPEGRGFDETGDKGFVLIETGTYHTEAKFIASAKRKLYALNVPITGMNRSLDVLRAVEKTVADIPRESLVRVILTGERTLQTQYDPEQIADSFREKFYYFEIKDESKLKITPEDYRYDKSLKGEFIRLVSSDEALSDEEKSDIITCGLQALIGEQ